MKRSRTRNKYLKTKSDIDRKAYNKLLNLCVSLIRGEKKNFFKGIFRPIFYIDINTHSDKK